VIEDISKDPKGSQICVSRASSELLKRLFEMEVPEIYDGTVVIKSAVREPGERAKIAVSSNEKDVDPVGACVGMKGSRVQSIIKELRGEKIDIIAWSDEPSVFAANALSPAKVSQVRITDIDTREMTVIVSEDQQSLAIGKRGQNVRLASRLIGWNIKIISEEVVKKEVALEMGRLMAEGEPVPVTALEAVTAAQADDLRAHNITDVETLATTTVDQLVEFLDVSLDEAERIVNSAKEIVAAKEQLTNPGPLATETGDEETPAVEKHEDETEDEAAAVTAIDSMEESEPAEAETVAQTEEVSEEETTTEITEAGVDEKAVKETEE
jgi:N utilization substance protein A